MNQESKPNPEPTGASLPANLIDHPPHYTAHPSGVECIQITEHMSFCVGNAIKYLWRADLKGHALDDLKKAAWYIQREIERRERLTGSTTVEPARKRKSTR